LVRDSIIFTNKISNKKRFLLFLATFFITLQAYYFYQISLSPLPVLGGLLFVLMGFKTSLSKEVILRVSIILVFFSFSLIWGIINLVDFIYVNTIIGSFVNLIFLIFFIEVFKNLYSGIVSNILKYILIIHLIFFFIQFIAFYLFGNFLDFLGPVTGEISRIEFGGSITGFARCTGLYNEPAAFSYFLGATIYLRMSLSKQVDFISFLALISLIITLSISGIILSFILYTYYVLFIKKKVIGILSLILFLSLLIIFTMIYFNDSIYSYVFDRLTNFSDDTSVNIRFTSSLDYLKSSGILTKMFGLGLGNSVKDVGLATSGMVGIFSSFGIIGSFSFLLILFFVIKPHFFSDFLFFLLFLLSTITIQTVFFWFLFSIIYCNENYYKTRY